jgi:dienelactone hydrolase
MTKDLASKFTRTGILAFGLMLAACASPASEDLTDARSGQLFVDRGKFEVGVTTLDLSDRKIEVYYPAAPGAAAGRTNEVYLQTDPLPPMLKSLTSRIPAEVDLSVSVLAFRDVPSASGRSYPLVIFSHGAGGWRSGHGKLLSGIASWGFVVASVDFPEYGFSSFAGGAARDMSTRRATSAAAVDSALDLLASAAGASEGPLSGIIDMSKIAAVGHSAGGGTMFAQIDNPRIDSIIGWAPVPPQGPGTTSKPTLIIAAEIDSGIPVASLVTAYDSLKAPKRLAVVSRMGHNAFSDSCLAIHSGNDLISAAKEIGLPVPAPLLELAQNGCRPEDLDTETGWAIIQHLTVAQLRFSLGLPGASPTIETELGPRFAATMFELRDAQRELEP